MIGKYLLENLARIPTQVTYGAEFRYAHPVIEPDTLVIAISQSGETADTLRRPARGKAHGCRDDRHLQRRRVHIARECGKGIYIHAGPEMGVASTKAFTSQLVVLSLLAVHHGTHARAVAPRRPSLPRRPGTASRAGAAASWHSGRGSRSMARKYAQFNDFLYIGRLYEYPTALEGALKLKEISYIHAEGVQAAEMKHGPDRPHRARTSPPSSWPPRRRSGTR